MKYIGYRKGRRKQVPVPMAVRTIQAKINETAALIERAKKLKGQNFGKTEQEAVLIQRYQILEKELYKLWRNEKCERWAQWIKNLIKLDHIKATREFYREIRSKNAEEEELGPIVNEQGKLSTTLKECLENWKNYYERLYCGPKGKKQRRGRGEGG